jgi:carbon storage regulator CsrA
MLVLSRGRNDKIVFPTLGITVEILRVNGGNVRLGVDAAKDIPVLRGELVGEADVAAMQNLQPQAGADLSHSARNRLQKATLGLRLLQKMLDAGQAADVEPTIFKIFNELKSLEAELAPTRSAAASQRECGPGRRALVVEDDVNENELLTGYLRLSGFEVSSAHDGLQAMVHLSKQERPNVVLLDMKMPRFDGRKTVAAIRSNPAYQDLKIFAVTGTEQIEAAVDVGPQGVDRWFRKPVDPEQLVDAINAALTVEFATA